MGLKGNLRRIKKPANRLAGPALTSADLACRMATAAGVMICRQPMGRGILSASCLPTTGQAAQVGRYTRTSSLGRGVCLAGWGPRVLLSHFHQG
jgi:hypothetical protein